MSDTPVHKQPDAAWIAEDGTAWMVTAIESHGAAEMMDGRGAHLRVPRLDLKVASIDNPEVERTVHLLFGPGAELRVALIREIRMAYEFAEGT